VDINFLNTGSLSLKRLPIKSYSAPINEHSNSHHIHWLPCPVNTNATRGCCCDDGKFPETTAKGTSFFVESFEILSFAKGTSFFLESFEILSFAKGTSFSAE
jgi:hypothetical protein